MSRLHRQKMRQRARAEHAQFTRGDVAAEAAARRAVDAATESPTALKPSRVKRPRRKSVTKRKAPAKHR